MSLVRYRISTIQFSVASPEEIMNSSVLRVTEPNLYSKFSNNIHPIIALRFKRSNNNTILSYNY